MKREKKPFVLKLATLETVFVLPIAIVLLLRKCDLNGPVFKIQVDINNYYCWLHLSVDTRQENMF